MAGGFGSSYSTRYKERAWTVRTIGMDFNMVKRRTIQHSGGDESYVVEVIETAANLSLRLSTPLHPA